MAGEYLMNMVVVYPEQTGKNEREGSMNSLFHPGAAVPNGYFIRELQFLMDISKMKTSLWPYTHQQHLFRSQFPLKT